MYVCVFVDVRGFGFLGSGCRGLELLGSGLGVRVRLGVLCIGGFWMGRKIELGAACQQV